MTRFTYDQHEALHVATKHAAAKDYADMQRIEPGMFAAVRQESDDEIRARNVACTPVPAAHVSECFSGVSNGESGV